LISNSKLETRNPKLFLKMESGDREPAITNYRRSLELNPGNSNAVRMLKRLERKK